jgi:hypothetical protein
MLNEIIAIIIALAGFPVGLLIAKSTKEELKSGRLLFKILISLAVVGIIISLIFAQGEAMLFLAASSVFIMLLAIASLVYARQTSFRAKKRIKRRYK